MGLVQSADESAVLAASLESNDGLYLVPAFTGLGAPHWNPHTRGTLLGMTRDTGPAHIARAVAEAVCYQSYELLEAMADDVGKDIEMLRIDGGMANNDWLAQYLADITRNPLPGPPFWKPPHSVRHALPAFRQESLMISTLCRRRGSPAKGSIHR